jgi:hypothetical protein
MKKILIAASFLLVLQACGPSTKITKSWRDPESSINPQTFSKVIISAFIRDESGRRTVEDELVKRLNGKGVASYTMNFSGLDTTAGSTALQDKLKSEGFDGAIVMRLVDVEKEVNYVPGTTYPTYYGRYGGYYGGYYGYGSPGYYQEDKVYNVETNIYSLKTDKLMWSGTTATTNPSNLNKTINEIADVIADKMRQEGFLKTQ